VPRSLPEIRRIRLDDEVEVVLVETAADGLEDVSLDEDEEEVALLVTDGHDDRTIAARRGTTAEDAMRQRWRIYEKLGVSTADELRTKLFG
jgi:DNA-binding NarL/FixJ family response regulator